jgi:deoxyxylulose-5-phosphate synthase
MAKDEKIVALTAAMPDGTGILRCPREVSGTIV